MPEAPAISIVVPCYNYGHYLPDTLHGIISQDFSDWECIVVDDGSTDGTKDAAEGLIRADGRIRYIYQQNAGLSAARNAGLAAARGAYIQFLDADDSIAAQKLSKQHAYLQAHPEADLVYGNALYFTESIENLARFREGVSHVAIQPRQSACGNDLLRLLCRDNIMEVSCPLVRSTLVRRVGLFDTAYHSFEDWQYWVRCALAGACFHYREEEGTETYIRYGHASMMRQLNKMNAAGIQMRGFMQPYLKGSLAWYNRYRIVKLAGKKLWLLLQR